MGAAAHLAVKAVESTGRPERIAGLQAKALLQS